MDLELKDKTAIVTGGGSNIGRGIVLRLAKEGANVIIADIDEKQGQKTAGDAGKLGGGGKTIAVKTDATSYDSVKAMVEQVIREFGRVDILVNNLGWDEYKLFIDTTPELWDKIIALNYRANLNMTKTVLPYMMDQKSGRIVNIGSDAGRAGEYREAVYAGTKGAVIAFSKSIAKEIGKYGITVNVVCPGVVVPQMTEVKGELSMWKEGEGMAAVFTPEIQQKAKASYPLRRLGTPEDIADVVAFLVSERAGYITGQTISASGGYTMM